MGERERKQQAAQLAVPAQSSSDGWMLGSRRNGAKRQKSENNQNPPNSLKDISTANENTEKI